VLLLASSAKFMEDLCSANVVSDGIEAQLSSFLAVALMMDPGALLLCSAPTIKPIPIPIPSDKLFVIPTVAVKAAALTDFMAIEVMVVPALDSDETEFWELGLGEKPDPSGNACAEADVRSEGAMLVEDAVGMGEGKSRSSIM
jgi:hypothetical protein